MVNLTGSWETDAEKWKEKFYETLIVENKVTSQWTKQLKEIITRSDYLTNSEKEFLAHFAQG